MEEEKLSEGISRRSFIKGAAVGTAAAAISPGSGFAASKSEGAAPKKWNKEVDVVIVGHGFAGAVTAIAATDAGAKAVILEKMPFPAGCSAAAGGAVGIVTDVEKAFAYFRLLCSRTPEDVVRAFCEEAGRNEAYVRKLAAINGAKIEVSTGIDAGGVYDLPGREAYTGVTISEIPGFTSLPGVYNPTGGTRLMKVMIDNVNQRKVEVMFSTPVKELVVDRNGVVVGVIAESKGAPMMIKAKKAVVLACGGFEHNPEIQKRYLQGSRYISYAHPSNTGDGIAMVEKAGAQMAGMFHFHGSYGFEVPGFKTGFRHNGPSGTTGRPERLTPAPWIVVDKMGKRYMNEFMPMPQDLNARPMELFDGSLWLNPFYKPGATGYPRIPSWIIFDEEGRKWRAIAGTSWENYRWSRDNSAEVEKGWIVKANALNELASKILADPQNDGLMDAGMLEKTVARWNEIVRSGQTDPDFRRGPKSFFKPIETAPFYAMKCWPIITNTQGGPVHNAKQQILDGFGKPIPRLYAAGELGSMFRAVYETMGNIAECLTSGRIAGKNAAAEKPLG